MKQYWIIFFGCLSVFCSIFSQGVPQIRSLIERQESIDSHCFLHRCKTIDDQITNTWLIDGSVVEQSVFEERYAQSIANEARRELQQRLVVQEQEAAWSLEMKSIIMNRLYMDVIKRGNVLFKRYSHSFLDQFFVYSGTSTFSDNASFLAAKQIFTSSEVKVPEKITSELVASYEDLIERINLFFKQAISNAIQSCSDTKVLKELLTLVSND